MYRKHLSESLEHLASDNGADMHKYEYEKLPPDDPKKRRPDISLAKHILDGWEPKVPLREGVCNTIEYFKGILQKY